MNEPGLLQGRHIGAAELEQVSQLLATHPDWSRRRLSCQLATLWNWRNQAGRLKDMAARTLLLKLEQRGWITLPPRRRVACNRMRQKQMPAVELPVPKSPITGPLWAFLPLEITEVGTSAGAARRALFEALLHQHHYLGHRGCVGENMQYLVCDRSGHPVACVLFGAAAWQCADRDQYIGWDPQARARGLSLIANNTRFLIPAWVQVRHLASHVLGQIAHRVSRDWQAKYGHPIYLLETFVQRDCFRGTCYQAANWSRVGQTKGRSRQDGLDGKHQQVPIKGVYLCPLDPHFRERLQAPQLP